MRKDEIVITFSLDGTPTVEVNGVSGKLCAAMTKDLMDAFGGDVIFDVKKPEYYQSSEATTSRKATQRA